MIISIAYLIGLLYALVMLSFIYGNYRLPIAPKLSEDNDTKVSIVIPYRNEEEMLEKIILCLKEQDYSSEKLEVILVNDYSTDGSKSVLENLVNRFSLFTMIDNKRNQGKKYALEEGITFAQNELIITTDADCQMGKGWVSAMVRSYNHFEAKMIVGPVKLTVQKSWLRSIIKLEFSALISATAGAIGINRAFMCNGANLAFSRKLFLELDPFSNNKEISSGDDVFMLHALKERFSGAAKVHFANSKEAIVYADQKQSFLEFFHQRLRWAKKGMKYKDTFSILLGWVVLLMNCSILGLVIGAILGKISFVCGLGLFLMKFLLDISLVYSSPSWLREKNVFMGSIFLSLFYPVYVAIIALLSLLFRPIWKGRKI